jgi:hypothetical protein
MTIQTGIRVHGSSSQRSFTLGPLFANDGFWFSFAPLYAAMDGEMIVDDTTGRQVGVVFDVPSQPEPAPYNDIAGILRPVLIDRIEKSPGGHPSYLADALNHLGEPVWRKGATGRSQGSITGLDGPFHIKQSDGEIGRYTGAMDVTGKAFAERGDGGSSIISNDGGLLGVLIGVAGQRYYCVPATAIRDRFFPSSNIPRILV